MTGRVRLVVTGSRDWHDHSAVWALLDDALRDATADGKRLTVMHGGCQNRRGELVGADSHADQWARMLPAAVDLQQWTANWAVHGHAAGPIRNRQMVRLLDPDRDRVAAFLGPCTRKSCGRRSVHGSHGTEDCGQAARAAGIEPVWTCAPGVPVPEPTRIRPEVG